VWPVLRRGSVAATVILLWLGMAAPAWSHSFLATTRPAQGERLDGPPREVALQLSEPVDPGTARVEASDGDGGLVEVGQLEFDSGGAVVRLPLVSPGDGLYRVSWHVVSAIDGHESAGEFAFAVGDEVALGEMASSDARRGTRPSPVGTAATWLLLAGWSVAFGAAVLALRAPAAGFPGRPRNWIRAGTLTALTGLAARLAVTPGQATTVALVSSVLLASALLLAGARRRWPALAALAAFAVAWPARGHASVTLMGWVLDTVHLMAAGLWAGGLTLVVVALAAAARRGQASQALPLVRVYARLAVAAVATLLATGIALGWTLVPSLDSLVGDGYGRLVAVKVALAVLAAAAAFVAQRRLAASDADRLRRVVRPEHVTLGLALLVAAALIDTPPRPPTADTLLGPPPIEGPVARVAGMAGLITLDVQAGDGRLDVNARGPSGGIDADLTLAAVLPDGTELDLHPRPCGVGCATLAYDLPRGETLLIASAEADGWKGGTTSLELRWPPAEEDPALFERMRRAVADVDELVVIEQSGSDPIPGAAGAPMSGETLVQLMPWAGGGVTDIRPVPGEPGRFTFYLPGSYMWFDVTVDTHDRLVYQRLVNPGHDIRYRFRYPASGDGPSAPGASS
jgi:copper transport protein